MRQCRVAGHTLSRSSVVKMEDAAAGYRMFRSRDRMEIPSQTFFKIDRILDTILLSLNS